MGRDVAYWPGLPELEIAALERAACRLRGFAGLARIYASRELLAGRVAIGPSLLQTHLGVRADSPGCCVGSPGRTRTADLVVNSLSEAKPKKT